MNHVQYCRDVSIDASDCLNVNFDKKDVQRPFFVNGQQTMDNRQKNFIPNFSFLIFSIFVTA